MCENVIKGSHVAKIVVIYQLAVNRQTEIRTDFHICNFLYVLTVNEYNFCNFTREFSVEKYAKNTNGGP